MDEAKKEAIKFLEEEKNEVAKVGDKIEFKLEDIPTPEETVVENLLKDMADNAEKLDEEVKVEPKVEPKPKRKRTKKVK